MLPSRDWSLYKLEWRILHSLHILHLLGTLRAIIDVCIIPSRVYICKWTLTTSLYSPTLSQHQYSVLGKHCYIFLFVLFIRYMFSSARWILENVFAIFEGATHAPFCGSIQGNLFSIYARTRNTYSGFMMQVAESLHEFQLEYMNRFHLTRS